MLIEKKIIRPIITEKGMALAADNKYVFQVAMNATKHGVQKEIKELFGVDVIHVQTIIMPGKKRRMLKTARFTKTAKWKKAIVKVKDGQKIDMFPKESK